ncbi:hypothetical protein PVAP13_8KG032402 [Panicum virgatum]|uniref:Uncharacterized protein n=1 Tax=Panicum virgatum TaxID=38727 RepID=A0A8T0PLS0_PANVG|nr:hypothetical protein PVAP13_8KG032402 [Panicum virgatum]
MKYRPPWTVNRMPVHPLARLWTPAHAVGRRQRRSGTTTAPAQAWRPPPRRARLDETPLFSLFVLALLTALRRCREPGATTGAGLRAAGGEPRSKKRERRHRSRRASPCRLRPPSPTLPSLNGQLRDARMRALRRGGEQCWPGPPIVKASAHTVRRLSAERARRGEARCCGTRGAPPTAGHRAGTRRWAEHVHFAAAPGTLCGWVVGAVREDWQTANILVVTSACTSRSSARSLYWILDDNIMASHGVNLRARLIDSYCNAGDAPSRQPAGSQG